MPNRISNSTGIILAGGENTRMPVLKSFIKVKGRSIISRNLSILKGLFDRNFIVTNHPELYSRLRTPMLGDVYNVRGPMSGVFTALLNSPTEWIFVIACDMPFISRELILSMADLRGNHDAVMPKSPYSPFSKRGRKGDYSETLFAFYSRGLLPSMERDLCRGKRGLRDFLKGKRVKYINRKEALKTAGRERSFINLNTPADIERYLDLEDRLIFNNNRARRE
ncbi:MAG: molybdenum cofactor guanylyltransferase [Nitrospirae bacterium]|nr:molybdenum cofactor guanylyltransferase [Nitrospirota bacterium]